MAKLYAWVGKILRVDLTEGKITTVPTENYVPKFIGGRGVGAKIYWDEVPPEVGAFDPENRLIFMTGPLTGTLAVTSGRTLLVGKSPQTYPTEFYMRSSMGGHWGPELKFAGFDGIIVQGRASEPVYLWIHDGEAEIRDASVLWGLNTYATQEELWRRHGEKARCVVIGPAGEHLVRESVILSDDGSAFGHGGCGAVMGSKNLKAIAVRGTGGIPVARPKELLEARWYASRHLTRKEGEEETPAAPRGQRSFLPVELGTEWEDSAIYEEVKKGRLKLGFAACYSCPTACGLSHRWLDGSHANGGATRCMEILSYATQPQSYYGGKLYSEVSYEVNKLCDLLGVRNWHIYAISFGAFPEAIKAGILTKENTGLPLDKIGSLEFAREYHYKMAYREGIGDSLAEGIPRFFHRLGGEAVKLLERTYITHGKFGGLYSLSAMMIAWGVDPGRVLLIQEALFPVKPKNFWVYHLRYPALFHLYPVVKDGTKEEEARKAMGRKIFGSEKATDETTWEYKVHVARWGFHYYEVLDSLILCEWQFPTTYCKYTPDKVGDVTIAAKLYSPVTGIDATLEDLLRIGERIFNLERAILVREGCTREDNWHSDFIFDSVDWLDREEFRKVMDEFYLAAGWDVATGIPTRARLEELGLKDIADDMKIKYGVTVPP